MSTGLVCARVERERSHEEAVVGRGVDVPSAVGVGHVAVEELGRHLVEERDAVRRDGDRVDVRSRLGEEVSSGGTRDTIGLRDRGFGDLSKLVPVRHVRINDRVLTVDSRDVGVGGDVSRGADAKVERLNRPLEVVEEDVVAGLVDVAELALVHTHERESNALDEDLMDVRVDEDVVDVEIEVVELRRGEHRGREVRGRERARVDDGAEKVLRAGEVNVDEALAVRDADRGDGETRIRVEPEEERDEHLKILVLLLVSLVTIVVLERGARVLGGRGVSRIIVVLVHGINRDLLADVLVPADLLARADRKLAVHVVGIREVLIERVAVHDEADRLEETLTREVAPTVEGAVHRVVHRRTSEGDRRGSDLDVDNHVTEEVTELRDRELNLRAEDRVGDNLVVLKSHSRERLVARVHEHDVSLLNVLERRGRVREVRANLLDRSETLRERLGGHKHLVLTTFIVDEVKKTAGRHL